MLRLFTLFRHSSVSLREEPVKSLWYMFENRIRLQLGPIGENSRPQLVLPECAPRLVDCWSKWSSEFFLMLKLCLSIITSAKFKLSLFQQLGTDASTGPANDVLNKRPN
ncbi:hypothetical protein SLEP1_g48432 [Rubroshorea leprosula]|uniref:Uncharacterized protein n=1 Tax=Rubroshorea leprosula TaxID=152421 RepID=A0AAV5LTT0_9ROSI|nr:hypothetical protein SLEP1_g48432 [Rubroshorea leprosula]